jgi:hypothetical protein
MIQLRLIVPTLLLTVALGASSQADGIDCAPTTTVSVSSPQPGGATPPPGWSLPSPRVIFEEDDQGSITTVLVYTKEPAANPFAGGQVSFEANSGVYCSQRGLGPRTPTFDFAPLNVRLGLELNDPCLFGGVEALAELSTAPVVSGFGNIVVGPTALLRYNFLHRDLPFVPYLQGGAGFAYTDASYDRTQHAIGQDVEFTIKAALGFQYLLNDHLALNVEGGVTHISNANMASRNLGINAVGASLGLTYYLPCPGR